MKKALKIFWKSIKILLITLFIVIVLVSIALAVVMNNQTKVTKIALEEVSNMIKAPVSINEVSLTLFHSFPLATVELSGLTVGSNADTANIVPEDTLVFIDKVYISLNSKLILEEKYEVEKIEIEGTKLSYLVDTAGKTNFDFLMESDTSIAEVPDTLQVDTSTSILDVLLKDLSLKNVSVKYDDRSMKAAAFVQIPELNLSAKILDESYKADLDGSIKLSDVAFDTTNIHLMEQSTLNFNVNYDNDKIKINNFELFSDGLNIASSGNTALGDSIFMDLKLAVKEMDLKELSKYVPKEMLSEFGVEDFTGNININSDIKGYYFDTLLLPEVMASISFADGFVKTKDYPEIQKLAFSGDISAPNAYDLKTISLDFDNFEIQTPQNTIKTNFSVSDLEKPTYKLNLAGNFNFDEIEPFLPDSTLEYLTGKMDITVSTAGTLPDDLGPASTDYFMRNTAMTVNVRNVSTAMDSVQEIKNLNFNFKYTPSKYISINNLHFEAPGYDIKLEPALLKAQLSGNVNYLNTLACRIDSFYFKTGSNMLTGSAYFKNIDKPTYRINTKIDLDFDELTKYIPDSTVEHISGKLNLTAKSYGTLNLDSIDTQIMPIVFEQTEIETKLDKFEFEMFDDPLIKVDKMSFDFAMKDDTIKIDNFWTYVHGFKVNIDSTEIWNAYKAALLEQRDKELIVNTHIKTNYIDYAKVEKLMNDFLEESEPESAPSSETNSQQTAKPNTNASEAIETESDTAGSYMPKYIIRGTLATAGLKYEKVVLDDISTKFRVTDSLYVIDELIIKAFGGVTNTSLVYDIRNYPETKIDLKNSTEKMDIQKLLYDSDNFWGGQDYITHENFDGLYSGNLNGTIFTMNDTTVLYEDMKIKGNFVLENGNLYEFEPIKELSYLPMFNKEGNIEFQTLKTELFIYNNDIYFPKTNIISSATDMSVYGMQSFNEDYEYHIKVFLKDMLLGKGKKMKRKQKELEDYDREKGMQLVAMDVDGNSKYGKDEKGLQRNMLLKIRVQRNGLNLFFKDKLFNFSTDLDRKEFKRN